MTTINPDSLITNLFSNSGSTPSPWFTVANQFLPRNLHDVIKWARYITIQSPTATEVIRKLCTYPITDFIVNTDSDQIKDRYKAIFESFKLKQTLQDVGFDYYTLGNVFVSIYFPVQRNLICPNIACGTIYNAKKAEFLTFKNYSFIGECPKCRHKGNFIRSDIKSHNIADMNLIKWDPENIAVAHNQITGESEYYYRIPNDIKNKVKRGDRLFVNSVPWGFIDAIKNNQDFKFDANNIFHLRNLSTGAIVDGCSIPPLISLFNLVFYQATLRKANEAIATEHMNPLRVVFPQPQTANSDPVVAMSMKNFVDNMQDAIKKQKKDKNYFLIAPSPIGYQSIGGEGKNLLVSAEIDQAEEAILLSLGVSKELLSGTTNWTSSTVGLRLLENTMLGYTTQIVKLTNWVMSKVTTYLNVTNCDITMVPFRLADDDILKQNLVQLLEANKVSNTTVYESMRMDYKEELKRMKEDAISIAVMQVEQQASVDQAVFLAAKKAGDQLDRNTDYQAKLAQAQEIAQQLSGQDPAMAVDILNQMKLTDYPLYILVNKLLMERNQTTSGITPPEAEDQDGTEGNAPPPTPGDSEQQEVPHIGAKPKSKDGDDKDGKDKKKIQNKSKAKSK